jgi:hypothetical protein
MDKRIDFLNEVWPTLQKEKDNEVIREFINKMVVLNEKYNCDGGVYPDIRYVLSMVKDEIKSINSQIELMEQSKVRKLKKKKPDSDSESDSEETKEKTRQEIKAKWLKSFDK